MTNEALFRPLPLSRGPEWKNRFVLAPLTNCQSHADGTLSNEERNWLVMRAKGDFGMVMTCAAHVQARGQGFPGQLGVFDDKHIAGLSVLADQLRANGAVSALQLHHAGIRAEAGLVSDIVGASDDEPTGARAMDEDEVAQVIQDYILAGVRAEQAGFDGVELHGAHGYLVAQFLSAETNHRTDQYGGSLENRARMIFEIIDGLRSRCRPDFQIGLRLSPERFGMVLGEVKDVAAEVMRQGKIDYLDMSLWDAFKQPDDEAAQDKSLLAHFADLPRGSVKLCAAGKVRSAQQAADMLEMGCDFAMIGRAAILHHDLPRRVRADGTYAPPPLPVSEQHLADEGVSPVFVDYLRAFRMVA